MAESFITVNDVNGFWVEDSIMQVVCWGLVTIIDHSPREEDLWMKSDFREHIFNNSQGIFIGFMHLGINEHENNSNHLESIKYIIRQAKIFFQSKGEFITEDELNSFQKIKETRRTWISPLGVHRVNKVLDFLDLLLDGKLKYEVGDTQKYSF